MYGDLIYLSNQAEICALQEREFGRVLRSEMWWFDTLKSTFDSSSKCCWRTLMERLGLIQQSLARFGDLMLWRVPLICLQSVVEELLWGVLAWSNRASFFVDFKRRWRLENVSIGVVAEHGGSIRNKDTIECCNNIRKKKRKRGRERPPCIPAKTGGDCADSKKRRRSRASYNRKKGNAVYF